MSLKHPSILAVITIVIVSMSGCLFIYMDSKNDWIDGDGNPMSGAGWCDIASVLVRQEGRNLVLTIFVAEAAPVAPDHHIAYMWSIDLDKNPTTGWTHPILMDDLGVDAQPGVRKKPDSNTWEGFIMYADGRPDQTIPFTVSDKTITMTIELSLLDIFYPTSFSFLIRTYDKNYDSFDIAPNTGYVTIVTY